MHNKTGVPIHDMTRTLDYVREKVKDKILADSKTWITLIT